jgi:hypothetical protein
VAASSNDEISWAIDVVRGKIDGDRIEATRVLRVLGIPAHAVERAEQAAIRERPYGSARATRLPPKESEELRHAMGLEDEDPRPHWDPHHPNDLVFPQMTKEAARRILAERARAGLDGPERNPNAHHVRGRR